MQQGEHTFIIPVMGTGHTADTPIRVAPLGISATISLVDDLLLEQLRAHYCPLYGLLYEPIPRDAEDGRARRITAYLDMVDAIVTRRFAEIQALPLTPGTLKSLHFALLPEDSPVKRDYRRYLGMAAGPDRDALAAELTARMRPGSIDANIMVQVDRVNYDRHGAPLGDEYRDAMAALRGYARSRVSSTLVLSAGINQTLFRYMTQFRCFYRDETSVPPKRIALKVSDLRSARVQAAYLARMGLEVSEYRIESGLNCGGHAFPTAGHLLPVVLRDFQDHKQELADGPRAKVLAYYRAQGWEYPAAALHAQPVTTVQGGIGTHGEVQRLVEGYGVDRTGWATPFLLVPEATSVDAITRAQLAHAGPADLYVSEASPLGVPYNNLRGCGSERDRLERIAAGTPGSPCPKGFGVTNTEFTERPICLASRQYQRHKLAQIDAMDTSEERKASLRATVMSRSCICDHLGNSALIALGIAQEGTAPQAVCPGPNLAWFSRSYTLREMVDHIYGRGRCLVPANRPHMFAAEMVLYVDFYERMVARDDLSSSERTYLQRFAENLVASMAYCLEVAEAAPYPGENLASLAPCVAEQRARLEALQADLRARYAHERE
jgi:hypothetical protein